MKEGDLDSLLKDIWTTHRSTNFKDFPNDSLRDFDVF
jgi:hypothetical protein